jgi:hypothetical protein
MRLQVLTAVLVKIHILLNVLTLKLQAFPSLQNIWCCLPCGTAPHLTRRTSSVNIWHSFGFSVCSWPLGRPRHRWECNITIDIKEVGWYGRWGAGFIFALDTDEWQAVVNTLLWWWTFGYHKMLGICWLAEQLPFSVSFMYCGYGSGYG